MRHLGAAALALLTCACSTAPIVMPASFADSGTRGTATAVRTAAPPQDCPLRVATVRDLRPDPDYLGQLAGRPVIGTHFGAWVESGLAQLLPPPGPAASNALDLEVDVLKAHMSSLNISKSANIVVRARFRRGETPVGEATLRGADTSSNMASTESETRAAFVAALRDLVGGLRTAAGQHCGAAAPAPTAARSP